MAFKSATGYNNLPNGAWSPVIYSKKAQLAFRKSSTVQDLVNSDYMGEISQYGDSVQILKEPEISVRAYSRGQQIVAQDLIDEDFTLRIDQANYFAFTTDDIEKSQSHVNWLDMATDRAGYKLRDHYDAEILGYIAGYKPAAPGANANVPVTAADNPGTNAISTAGIDELLAVNKLIKGSFGSITTAGAADHSIPLAPRLPGATTVPTDVLSPLTLISRMSTRLDQQFVDTEGRWLVVDPVFMEMLRDEDSRLFQSEWGDTGGLRNGLRLKNLHGFRIYVSNNLPRIGTGPATLGTANQNANFGVLIAGHNSAIAAAEQISKVESFRSQDTFGDIVRGMHLYGRKKLRPEAIITAKYNVA